MAVYCMRVHYLAVYPHCFPTQRTHKKVNGTRQAHSPRNQVTACLCGLPQPISWQIMKKTTMHILINYTISSYESSNWGYGT